MDFSGLRIGFVPMSDVQMHPFDLRNFIYYARKRKISFEIAKFGEEYDVIVLSPRADVSLWSRYQGKARLIYLIVDAYLAVSPLDMKGSLRGLAKYIGGEHKNLKLNYSSAIREMCLRADAVVCTTLEQKKDIQEYCNNIHIILDFNSHIVRETKLNYKAGKCINLIWEGQAASIKGFTQIKKPLLALREKYPIALHIITDLERGRYMEKFKKISVLDDLRRIFGDSYLPNTSGGNGSFVYLYQWNLEMLSRIITGADIAIIPLDLRDPLMCGKPENKLILFWRMGMPSVVSSIPAYERVMTECGLDLCCKSDSQWLAKLEELIVDQTKRESVAVKAKAFADRYYSEEEYLKKWDQLFQSVLDK